MNYHLKQRSHSTQFSLQCNPKTTKLNQETNEGLINSQRQGNCAYHQELLTPKNAESGAKYFSNRDSGKLNERTVLRKKTAAIGQSLQMQIKAEIQKMPYRQKLFNVEGLVKKSRQLCKGFGYFYITFAMLSYYPEESMKLDIWIHPNIRCLKPLHPIIRNTQFQCELEFINSLRSLLKEIFPTLSFSKGKTFISLQRHIHDLIKVLDSKTKNSYLETSQRFSLADQNSSKGFDSPNSRRLAVSSKAMPKFHQFLVEEHDGEEQKHQTSKTNIYRKQTKSTLLESIRSNNSIRDKLRLFSLSNGDFSPNMKRSRKTSREHPKQNLPNLSGKIHYKLSQLSEEPEEPRTPSQKDSFTFQQPDNKRQLLEEFDSLVHGNYERKKTEEQPLEQVASSEANKRNTEINLQRVASEEEKRQNKKSLMKRSRLAKIMTTSIQIQSQLNNLFGNEEVGRDNFYDNLPEGRTVRNSILSKVAEQFEDLLF